jgi:hypothetical protein
MHEQPAPGQAPAHADIAYEKSDFSLTPIWIGGVGFVLFTLMGYGVSLWLFHALKAREDRKESGLPSLAAKERTRLPADLKRIPEPRLQVNEPRDVEELRAWEDKRLKDYGWTDAKKGTVHIPINEAMRLLVEKHKAAPKGGG